MTNNRERILHFMSFSSPSPSTAHPGALFVINENIWIYSSFFHFHQFLKVHFLYLFCLIWFPFLMNLQLFIRWNNIFKKAELWKIWFWKLSLNCFELLEKFFEELFSLLLLLRSVKNSWFLFRMNHLLLCTFRHG